MEVKYIDDKLEIFQDILAVNDEKLLRQLQFLITTFIAEHKEIHSEEQSEKITFEKWNMQFTDNKDLNDYLPEYEMTLGDFRRQIYDAEYGKTMTLNEFENRVKQWKTKKRAVKL